MVDRGSLLRSCAFTGTEGSNPFFSEFTNKTYIVYASRALYLILYTLYHTKWQRSEQDKELEFGIPTQGRHTWLRTTRWTLLMDWNSWSTTKKSKKELCLSSGRKNFIKLVSSIGEIFCIRKTVSILYKLSCASHEIVSRTYCVGFSPL